VKRFLIEQKFIDRNDYQKRYGQHQNERGKKGEEKGFAVDESSFAVIAAVNFDGFFAGPVMARDRKKHLHLFVLTADERAKNFQRVGFYEKQNRPEQDGEQGG
jgi:hypothetical protein